MAGRFVVAMLLISFGSGNGVADQLSAPPLSNPYPTSSDLGAVCPEYVYVDEKMPEYDEMAVRCLEGELANCTSMKVVVSTGFVSYHITMALEMVNKCRFDIHMYVDYGEESYKCEAPLSVMAAWKSWKDPRGSDTLDDVLPYCRIIAKPMEPLYVWLIFAAIIIVVALLGSAAWIHHYRLRQRQNNRNGVPQEEA
ncbi:MAG TPA: hypothetical protein VI893_07315 [Thermoplasmata archaeon]|nr:hypothetical protein [Thermoplasmata archaeon]